MPDPVKAETEEETSEYERFGEEYLGAKFRDEEDNEEIVATPDLSDDPPETPPAAAEAVVVEEPVTEQTWTIPDTADYGEFRGKKLTTKQLEENGLLQTIFSREHQETHHVGLYQGLKKEFDDYRANETARREEASRRAEIEARPAPVVNPQAESAAIRAQYETGLKAAAESGVFESDFLEAYPHVATQIEHRFNNGANVLAVIAKRVDDLTARVTGQEVHVTTSSSREFVNGQLDTLAQSDERLYGRLTTGEHRDGFISWMVADDNPLPFKNMKARDLTSQVLSGAYVSYLHATRGDRPAPKKPAERKPNMASGTGGSPGAGGGPSDEITSFGDELRAARAERLRGV